MNNLDKLLIFILIKINLTLIGAYEVYESSYCFSIDIPANVKFDWRVNNAVSLWRKFTTAYLTFPSKDYVYMEFGPPQAIALTPQNKANMAKILADLIERHFELKKYYKFKDVKSAKLPGNYRGFSHYIKAWNEKPDKKALLGRIFVFDMGKFVFFSYIYVDWKYQTIMKYKNYIEKVFFSYAPHLNRNTYLEKLIQGRWSGEAGYSTGLTYPDSSTNIVKTIFYKFLPGNQVITSSKALVSHSQSADDYNFGAIIRNKKPRIMKGTYYVYGLAKDRGLIVMLFPYGNNVTAKSIFFLLENNKNKMYVNYTAELYKY